MRLANGKLLHSAPPSLAGICPIAIVSLGANNGNPPVWYQLQESLNKIHKTNRSPVNKSCIDMAAPLEGESITYVPQNLPDRAPDLRFLHYNDVYHVDAASAEPVGGIARFMTLVEYYKNDVKFKGQPELLTFFSGDAYNPSLESSVSRGSHMVSILNNIGTDVACVGVRY
jgi:hypothetical protein